jgi:outer membrane protein
MIKKLLVFALACLLPLSIFAQDLKFGYFDRAEIFKNMPETVAASKKLDELQKRYKDEYDRIEGEYQKKGSDFVAARDSLPESIKQRRMSEIQDLEQRLQSYIKDSQADLQKQQQTLIVPINTKLMNAIKAVGQENGFVYIFDFCKCRYGLLVY